MSGLGDLYVGGDGVSGRTIAARISSMNIPKAHLSLFLSLYISPQVARDTYIARLRTLCNHRIAVNKFKLPQITIYPIKDLSHLYRPSTPTLQTIIILIYYHPF